ncbi:MAG: VCBS repeat-containing protein [Caldilinea sp.]
MRKIARYRRAHIAALLVLWFSLLPVAAVSPQAASAEGRAVDAPQAPSADASKEIVYLDGNGFIRVLDIYHGEKQVQWVSPTSGWRSIALGDFDNDGDMEIVAVRGTPGGAIAPELAIFDPVVATGTPIQGQEINGIPWKQLYSIPLPSRPELVFAGNFDPNIPGDEIGVSREIVASDGAASGDKTRVIIYKQTSLNPDGTDWTVHVQRDFSQTWNRVAVGNLDLSGGDEVAFVDEDKGEFNVYRPDAGFSKIGGPGGSSSRPMRDVAFGQYLRGGNLEVLAVRKESSKLEPTFEVYQYDNVNFQLNYATGDRLSPGPRVIAAGDINGSNDDDEAIMVRRCTGDCVRMIVRNDGGDGVIQQFLDGLPLDSDDGFRAVAAGDIDGDGRDEIVIMRDNKIRYFPDAHTSAAFVDVNVSTDRRNLVIGDLDRNGFISGPVIGSTPAQVMETAYFGFVSTGVIQLQNIATADAVPFVATTSASWLTVSPNVGLIPGRNSAPLNITYRIDATTLPAGNQFKATIIFTASAPNVVNSPFNVPVTIDVELPPFGAVPSEVTAFVYPCEEPFVEQSLTMDVVGFPGAKFSARVLDPVAATATSSLQGNFFVGELAENGVLLTDSMGAQFTLPDDDVRPAAVENFDWLSETPWVTAVSSPVDTLPTTISLTISPTLRTADFAETTLLLRSTDPQNPASPIFSLHPVRLACASQASWMPLIAR